MRSLVLSITSVFLLQLGFIAYTSTDPNAENSFVVVTPQPTYEQLQNTVSSPGESEVTLAHFDTEEPVYQPVAGDEPRETRPDQGRQRPVAAFARQAAKRPRNTFITNDTTQALAPIKVTYKIHPGVEFARFEESAAVRTEYPLSKAPYSESKRFEVSAKATPVRKKKNFLAKALPIVKKPYDWLKAVGSFVAK